MEPLQLAFLHPIKVLFYKDVCWPWGGLDPVSSPFMYAFWGEGLAQVRRIDYSSAGQRSFSSCRAKIAAFALLPPTTFRAWMTKWCLPGCRSPSHLCDATCIHGEPTATFQSGKCLKAVWLKSLHPKVRPPGHFYFCPAWRKIRRLQGKLPSYLF